MVAVHRFANPARFLRLSAAILPWSAAATALLLAAGFYFALFNSPPDYQQGETVRIMYVHVPSAWLSLMIYSVMAGASAGAPVSPPPAAPATPPATGAGAQAFPPPCRLTA